MEVSDAWKQPYEAWDKGDLKRAFRLFQTQAKAGQDHAQLNLGYFYDQGLGTRVNKVKAMQWYLRAYRKGEAAAASNIATLYRDKGKPRQALAWYLRAAQLKDGDAMLDAAKYFIAGVGARRNLVVARRLLKRAVAGTCITEAGREEARVWLATVAHPDTAAGRTRIRRAGR